MFKCPAQSITTDTFNKVEEETRALLYFKHHIICFHWWKEEKTDFFFYFCQKEFCKFVFGEVFNWHKNPAAPSNTGKYVQASKSLRFTGFNNPGNTNPLSARAKVVFSRAWSWGINQAFSLFYFFFLCPCNIDGDFRGKSDFKGKLQSDTFSCRANGVQV